MIKDFDTFLIESDNYSSMQIKMFAFLDEVNDYLIDKTDNRFRILHDDTSTIEHKGSVGLFRKKNKSTWTLERIIETGQFAIYIMSTIDSTPIRFAVNYIKDGFIFSAKNYSDEYSNFRTNSPEKETKDLLGENEYLAMKALSRNTMPTRISARPVAQKWLDLIKDFPKLDLTEHRGAISTRRFGI